MDGVNGMMLGTMLVKEVKGAYGRSELSPVVVRSWREERKALLGLLLPILLVFYFSSYKFTNLRIHHGQAIRRSA